MIWQGDLDSQSLRAVGGGILVGDFVQQQPDAEALTESMYT